MTLTSSRKPDKFDDRLRSEVEHWDVNPKVRGSNARVSEICWVKRMIGTYHRLLTVANWSSSFCAGVQLINISWNYKIFHVTGANTFSRPRCFSWIFEWCKLRKNIKYSRGRCKLIFQTEAFWNLRTTLPSRGRKFRKASRSRKFSPVDCDTGFTACLLCC